MNYSRTTLEAIAPTVEEAIEKGLEELGLRPDDVEVEVLDEGKRNLFRFASRQARVKLTVKDSVMGRAPAPEKKPDYTREEAQDDTLLIVDEEDDETRQLVTATVQEILQKMGVEALVSSEVVVLPEDHRQTVMVNIEGDDLSFLIGRKSETLNALQYITSLIVSHKRNHWVPLQLDVQNYRARRSTELQKLARRMAGQVISSGRRQSLEPMPANERRIVHVTLAQNEQVYTESVGEEPNRKVCIYPQDNSQPGK